MEAEQGHLFGYIAIGFIADCKGTFNNKVNDVGCGSGKALNSNCCKNSNNNDQRTNTLEHKRI